MPIYRMDETGRFVRFDEAAPELERQLEDWIEASPSLILEGEQLALVGRQTTTIYGKALDLLAVDQSGATVVIELKKGIPPRDVIAQALEYTAWVDSLSSEDLDAIAQAYSTQAHGTPMDVAELYDQTFSELVGDESDEDEEAGPSSRVTFNARQRIVIIAEAFPGEMEQTLRFLRGRLGIDITAVRFTVHKLEQETLLDTEVVVGREPVGSVKVAGVPSRPTQSHEEIREKVTSDFLRAQVDGLEAWIGELDQGITVEHYKGSHHSIYASGRHLGGYYFAAGWIHFWLNGRVSGDEDALRTLSNQGSAVIKPKRISGNAANESDLAVFKQQLRARVGGSAV